ncbi:MAG: CARDB domain-containing protein [Solirubrobacteraceae bacterium]|nr:CARDB domain-containing protein [Patulibacter sp.]
MHLTSSVRALVAIVAITGVTGTAATTASASSSKSHAKHAKAAKALKKKSKLRADLVARGLNLDFSDDGFDVTASVANTGKGLAKRSDVVIALSQDTTLDENDEVLDEYSLGSIAAGVTRSFETDVEMPDDDDFDGTAYLLVCADGNQEVKESSESNNCVSQEVDTTASDDSGASSDDSGDDDSADDDSDSGAVVLTDGQ